LKSQKYSYGERLLDFFDPSRSIPLFIIGTAALTLVLQALYDFANDPTQIQGGFLLAIGSLLVAVIIIVLTWRRRQSLGRIVILDKLKPQKRKGLILLAGPTEASAPASIEYHLPTISHCWIIATDESIGTAAKLAEKYAEKVPNIYYGSPNYIVNPDLIQHTYDMVVRILEVEAFQNNLSPNNIIADITGGTKPMTTGMGLACLARDFDMEYMKAPRDSSGHVIKGAKAEPIKIDTTFVPTAR